MKKILFILSILSCVGAAAAYPVLMFNPTNGAVLNATNLTLTPAQTGQVNALATAAAGTVLGTASNSFAATTVATNLTIAVLGGAGYAAANGQYINYDWNDIVNANCVNATNGNLYLLGGGATNNLNSTLTTNVLEIDDYSGGGVNIYYATNFSTNAAQIVWFAAATNYLPVPGSQAFTATNLAVGLGPVPVAQVATQIQNALLIGGTNVEASLAALAYPPGFNGAGLTNVAPTGPQIWGTWAGPQFVIYVAPYDLNTEAQVTNAIRTLVRMPQFTNLINAGIGFTMIMDVNATYRRNLAGVLQWNYSLYPHGPNFLTGLCTANGIGSVCAEYGNTVVHLPPGAAGAVCSVSGGAAGVIIYTGTNGVAYGTNYSDCALPEEFPADLSVIQSWGFGGVMVNDLASGGTLQQQWQLQSEAGAICANLRNASNIPFGYIAFDTPPGAGPGRALGNYTRTLHSAIAYDQAETDAETFLRGYSQDFAGGPAAGQGAWQVNNIFNSPQPQMTVNALISGWITPGWGGNEILNLTNEPCLTLATNALWQAIELDAGQALPALVQDLGTNGSVWTKAMTGGRFAVGIFNGGNAGSNITVSLPALAQGGMNYAVTNVWTTGSLGTFGPTLTASNLMARGSSNSTALWLCTPVMPPLTNIVSSLIATSSLAAANLTGAVPATNFPTSYYVDPNVLILTSVTNIPGSTNTANWNLTNSPFSFKLYPGTWYVEAMMVAYESAGASGGIQGGLSSVGTDQWFGLYDRGYVAAGPSFTTPSLGMYAANFLADTTSGQNGCFGHLWATVITTQTNTYNWYLQERQGGYVTNAPFIATNSFVLLRKLK